MRRLVIYFVCPIGGRRRKFVLAAPSAREVDHYLGIAEQIKTGARFRSVDLYGFYEESPDGRDRGEITDYIVNNPGGIRTVRIEQYPAPVQGQLMEATA